MESLNPKHFFASHAPEWMDDAIVHETHEIKTIPEILKDHRAWIFKKIYQWLRRYRLVIRIALTIILVAGLFALSETSYKAGFNQGIEEWSLLRRKLFLYTKAIEEYKASNQQLRQELVALKQSQVIQESAQQNITLQLRKLALENTELKEEKRLYQSVLEKSASTKRKDASATKPVGVLPQIDLKQFHVYPTLEHQQFRYQLLLASKLTQKKIMQGEVRMAISGKWEDNNITIPVQFLADPIAPQNLRFKFKQFQELSGTVALPLEFEPKMLMLSIQMVGSTQRVDYKLPWIVES